MKPDAEAPFYNGPLPQAITLSNIEICPGEYLKVSLRMKGYGLIGICKIDSNEKIKKDDFYGYYICREGIYERFNRITDQPRIAAN